MSVTPEPNWVLANSWFVVPLVLNIAQTLSKLSVRATCWKVAAPKVATPSSELPGPKVVSVLAKAPLTWRLPPETAAVPPAPPPCDSQVAPDQPAGSAGPPANSAPTAGRSMTSPFAVSET